MTEYKEEMIKKMQLEKDENDSAIQLAKNAIKDREHLIYLDKLNIKRWEKENEEIEKNIEMLKK